MGRSPTPSGRRCSEVGWWCDCRDGATRRLTWAGGARGLAGGSRELMRWTRSWTDPAPDLMPGRAGWTDVCRR